MISNINGIQNAADIKGLSKYTDEYLVDTLANMGQRSGTKGDGVSYSSFGFGDVLGQAVPSGETGFLRYVKDGGTVRAEFGHMTMKTKPGTSYTVSISHTDVLGLTKLKGDLTFSVQLNNIGKYRAGSLIRYKDGMLTYMLDGHIIGMQDTAEYDREVIYTRTDTQTGVILDAVRAFHMYGDFFMLMRLTGDGNAYTLTLMPFDAGLLPEASDGTDWTVARQLFRDSFTSSSTDGMTMTDTARLDAPFTGTDLFTVMMNLPENLTAHPPVTLPITYTGNVFACGTLTAAQSASLDELSGYGFDLSTRLGYLTTDAHDLYRYLMTEYDSVMYGSRTSFLRNILCAVYESVYDGKYGNFLFMPPDARIIYFHNSNDALGIYYSKDIPVTKTGLKSYDDASWYVYISNAGGLICTYTDSVTPHTGIYSFQTEWNATYTDLIDGIGVSMEYELPYINAAMHWQVDGADSGIAVRAAGGGTPNIVIAYMDNSGGEFEVTLMNSVSNKDAISPGKWTDTGTCTLYNQDGRLTSSGEDVTLNLALPSVTDSNRELLRDTTLFIICSKACADNGTQKAVGTDTRRTFMTIWTLGGNDKFTYVPEQPGQTYALSPAGGYDTSSSSQSVTYSRLLLEMQMAETGNSDNDGHDWFCIQQDKSADNELTVKALCYKKAYNQDSSDLAPYTDGTYYMTGVDDMSYTRYPIYAEVATGGTYTVTSADTKTYSKDVYVENKKVAADYYVTENDVTFDMTYSTVTEKVSYNYSVISTVTNNADVTEYRPSGSYHDEYIPAAGVPVLDMADMPAVNCNVFNRVNILGAGHDGRLYHTYIGTSPDDTDKSVLHIGTSHTDVNTGGGTLMSRKTADSMQEATCLKAEFSEVDLDARLVTASSPVWTRQYSAGTAYWSTSIMPVGHMSVNTLGTYISDGHCFLSGDEMHTNPSDGSLFVRACMLHTDTAAWDGKPAKGITDAAETDLTRTYGKVSLKYTDGRSGGTMELTPAPDMSHMAYVLDGTEGGVWDGSTEHTASMAADTIYVIAHPGDIIDMAAGFNIDESASLDMNNYDGKATGYGHAAAVKPASMNKYPDWLANGTAVCLGGTSADVSGMTVTCVSPGGTMLCLYDASAGTLTSNDVIYVYVAVLYNMKQMRGYVTDLLDVRALLKERLGVTEDGLTGISVDTRIKGMPGSGPGLVYIKDIYTKESHIYVQMPPCMLPDAVGDYTDTGRNMPACMPVTVMRWKTDDNILHVRLTFQGAPGYGYMSGWDMPYAYMGYFRYEGNNMVYRVCPAISSGDGTGDTEY